MPQTCALDSQTTKCPDLTSACSAIWVHIVPVGRYSAACLPVTSAALSCSLLTVGSSPYQSSPTSAAAMALRMASVGRVTVSERRSMRAVMVECPVVAGSLGCSIRHRKPATWLRYSRADSPGNEAGRRRGSPGSEQPMKALVKVRAEAGLRLEDVPVPAVGRDDVLIRVLRTGVCGTTCTSTNGTAGRRPTCPCRWSSGTSSPARSSSWDPMCATWRSATWSAAKDISSAGGAATAWQDAGCSARTSRAWRQPPGSFAEYIALAGRQRLAAPARNRPGCRGHLRSVRQRGAHGAHVSRCTARTC